MTKQIHRFRRRIAAASSIVELVLLYAGAVEGGFYAVLRPDFIAARDRLSK